MKSAKNDSDFEKTVFEAMRQGGWILPQTVQEVLKAEEELASKPIELPQGIADSYAVLDRPSPVIVRLGRFEDDTGRSISRTDALKIANQILEQAERERMEAAEQEASRGIQWEVSDVYR